MHKKVIAMILSAMMMLSVLPQTALADAGTSEVRQEETAIETAQEDAAVETEQEETAIETAQEDAVAETEQEAEVEEAGEETAEVEEEAVLSETDPTAPLPYTVGPLTDEMIEGFTFYEEVDEHSASIIDADSISLAELVNVNTLYDLLDDTGKSIYNTMVSASYDGSLSSSSNAVSVPVILEEDDNADDILQQYTSVYQNALLAFVYDNIERVPWFNGSVGLGYVASSSRISFTFKIGASAYYNDEVGAAIDAKMQEIAGIAGQTGEIYDYYKAVHDYLVLNSEYDTDAVGNNDHDSEQFYFAHSQAGVLTKGKGVCESYAKAFQALCNMESRFCLTVMSETHAWNYVRYDGIWYMVDCTFDDPVGAAADYCSHEYFFASNNPYVDDDHVPIRYEYPATSTEAYVHEEPEDPDVPTDGIVFDKDVSAVNSSGEVSVSLPVNVDPYAAYVYFTPAVDGKYVIESSSSNDPQGFVYRVGSESELAYCDDANGTADFQMEVELTAGVLYKVLIMDRGGCEDDYYDLVIRITHVSYDSCSHTSLAKHIEYNGTDYTAEEWYGESGYTYYKNGAGYEVPCNSEIEVKTVCGNCGELMDSYTTYKQHILKNTVYMVGDETYDSFIDVDAVFQEEPIIYKKDSTCDICDKDNSEIYYYDGGMDSYETYYERISDDVRCISVYDDSVDIPALADLYHEDNTMSRYTGVATIEEDVSDPTYMYFEDGVQDKERSGIVTVDGKTYLFKDGVGIEGEFYDIKDAAIIPGETSYTYNGSCIRPDITVTYDGKTLVEGTDYTLTLPEISNAGSNSFTVVGMGSYTGELDGTYEVQPLQSVVEVPYTSITKTLGDDAFTPNVTKTGEGTLEYSSSNTAVATVSASGKITIKGVGRTTISVYAAGTSNCIKSAAETITVTVNPKAPASAPTLTNTSTPGVKVAWTAVSGASGYIVYRKLSGEDAYKKVKSISSGTTVSWTDTGLVLGKTYTYKIKSYKKVDGVNYYSSCSAGKSTRALGVATISSIAKSGSKAKLTWKKCSGATGYQIVRKASTESSYKKVKTITSGSTVSWSDSNVVKGKKYSYKIRAYYKTSSGTIYYGAYSAAKSYTA